MSSRLCLTERGSLFHTKHIKTLEIELNLYHKVYGKIP